MSEPRTFGDLRKYRGGKELEKWEYEQRMKVVAPKKKDPDIEQARIPGTEALSYKPGYGPGKKRKGR